MSAPGSGPPGGPGGLLGKGLELVGGVTTWKRTAILLSLGMAALLGTLLYQHPEWIEESAGHWTTHVPVLADPGTIAAEVPAVRQILAARLVAVFGVNAGRNEQWMITYDAAPEWTAPAAELAAARWQSVMPMFTGGEQNEMLLRVVEGEVACTTLASEREGLAIAKALQLTVICAAGIPPGRDALLGYVAAGFGTALERAETSRVRVVLRKYGERWEH